MVSGYALKVRMILAASGALGMGCLLLLHSLST